MKNRKKTKITALILILILALLITTRYVFSAIRTFSSPLTNSSGFEQSFSGSERLNILVNFTTDRNNSSVYILSLAPKEDKIYQLLLPENLYLPVSHNAGYYQLGSIFGLGQLDKTPNGEKLLGESLSFFLAVPIEGYIEIDQRSKIKDQNYSDLKILKENLGLRNIIGAAFLNRNESLKSSFSPWQLWQIGKKVSAIRFDKIITQDLGKQAFLTAKNLADGTTVLESSSGILDSFLDGFFIDEKIKEESVRIEILNATDRAGLANQVLRLINNMGGQVVNVGNYSQKLDKSRIMGVKSYTGEKLGRFLGVLPEWKDLEGERGELVIIVGEDFEQKL